MIWGFREQLSQAEKLRRSYYELLRDDLDQFILKHALIESYQNFKDQGIAYPFVEQRELKPKARIPNIEYEAQNSFLVMFVEDTVPRVHKKYIRYFDDNRITKKNLLKAGSLPLNGTYDRSQKYFESVYFNDLIEHLLPVDYALLIQRDSASKKKDRYMLSHFHVRVDWPIADATENLARELRYISKDLYEKGDKLAEDLQKKYFEYYGLPVMAGGRRTAAVVAAQYLRKIKCISTVYVASSESRALLKFSERGTSKFILLKYPKTELNKLAESSGISLRSFTKNYIVANEGKNGVCIFRTTYDQTLHAKPPMDGKMRDLNTDPYWLTVHSQFILPKPGVWKYPPLPLNWIYS